jgi:putative oxidoreductase
MRIDQTLAALRPHVLSLLRIVAALLFIEHGLSKLTGFPTPGPAEMSTLIWAAAIIEVVGGLLLLVGFYARLAAFVMSGEMAFAYFMVHAPQSFYPIANRGDGAILFCFLFLYLAVAGPGPWSLDALRGEGAAVGQPAATTSSE